MTAAIKTDNPVRTAINKNFVIRWKHQDEKKYRLIGAGRYKYLVGEDFCQKHFEKVLNSSQQKISFKLRRGLEIIFVSK